MRSRIKAGDYFSCDWGYDQTNTDYCIVVSVSPSGKTATCRRASSIRVGATGTYDVVKPGTPYGEEFRLRTVEVLGEACLKGSYPFTKAGDKRKGLFSPTSIAESHLSSYWGH